jgi:hypothetical protein
MMYTFVKTTTYEISADAYDEAEKLMADEEYADGCIIDESTQFVGDDS